MARSVPKKKLTLHPDKKLSFYNIEFTLHDGSHVEYEAAHPRKGQDLVEMLVEAQDNLNISDEDVASYVFWKE